MRHGQQWVIVQNKLESLAKVVASSAAGLVLKAKGVAEQSHNKLEQNAVIGSATQCALAASQLVAVTKVLSPTIDSPECQEQLVEVAKQVAKAVDDVVATAEQSGCEGTLLTDLSGEGNAVIRALDNLMQFVKHGPAYSQRVCNLLLKFHLLC